MRKYLKYAIFALSAIFCACEKKNPCEEGGNLFCAGTDYGSAKLTDIGKFWLPDPLSQKIQYTTGTAGGPTHTFELKSWAHETFRDVLGVHGESRPCGTAYCEDYCTSEHKLIIYSSTTTPFTIDMRREKDYYDYLGELTKEKLESSKDRLMVKLLNKADTFKFVFRVYVDKKDDTPGYRYHDSVVFGARHHYEVYECYNERTSLSVPYIKGIYYTTANGLVGYYYNNGQLWYLK